MLLACDPFLIYDKTCDAGYRSFENLQDEANYYRAQARGLHDELEDVKLALAEFQASSKDLEDEMEKELANTERRERELRHETERLRSEVEILKV